MASDSAKLANITTWLPDNKYGISIIINKLLVLMV